MGTFLLCSTPVYGHVAPMLTVGSDLVRRGHRVSMLTGGRFAEQVRDAGMEHIALPAECDYDDRDPDAFGAGQLTGIRRLRFDIEHVFVGVMPHQYGGVRSVLDGRQFDAVLSETGFTGVLPLLLGDRWQRPPVLICGVLPLTVSSRDTAPFGMGLPPSSSRPGHLRNRVLNLLISKVVFRRSQQLAQQHLADLGVPPLPCFFLDFPALADQLLQLSSASFEYPRSDLHASVRFVGPVLPAAGAFDPPVWWPDMNAERPVVHVTQGTLANADLGRLVEPTLQALAGRDVLVVVSTGDQQSADELVRTAPANTRVAAFLPYRELLPKVDVMVTNGGYGGVQFALTHGVPLVVAGDTEDKPEVAGRVAWSGAGINLRTGTPTPAAIDRAVQTLLDHASYRTAAIRIGRDLAAGNALASIEQALSTASQTHPQHESGTSAPTP